MVRRGLRWGFWLYLALLGTSTAYRLVVDTLPPLPPGMERIHFVERDARGQPTDASTAIAYWDRPAREEGAPVVLLLHGSPVATSALQPLVEALDGRYRLIAPDLPGFGASDREELDFSVATHARYVEDLLAALEVERVHVVAYSMGGGVALHLAHKAPSRVASLVLLSAIGVQEYELFGDYTINHAVHAFQWAVLKALEWGVPHFGWFERQPLHMGYARNFLDTDQRPLRGILKRYVGPMLILHGTEDELVPFPAAVEHARLVPQAELVSYPAGHLFALTDPQMLVPDLERFIAEVERGEAVVRATAPAARVQAAGKPFVRDTSWHYGGLAAVLVALLLMFATFVSEDLTCIGAGLLAAKGLIPLEVAIVACFLGIFIGDLLLYIAGRQLGRPALRRRPLRWFVSVRAEREAEAWFHERGAIIILASRFLPGTRAATYFTAGVLRAPWLRFLLYFGVAAALWTPLLVLLAAHLGQAVVRFYEAYERWALPGVVLAGLLLYGLLELGLPLFSWRGRRLLLGRWRRLSRWEYWPIWFFNAPVVLRVLWLSVGRYRQPTVFTCCNPGIPHSGLIGESKAEILAQFPAERPYVLPWLLLEAGVDAEARKSQFATWQAALPTPWPVVLKPEEGQRGLGVVIARRETDLVRPLHQTEASWIAQAYAPGQEYGIFYYRYPSEATGRIWSITTKVMTAVTGDGQRTLEALILQDDRAVDLGLRFLDAHVDRLEWIPAAGERVPLVELGTHARGATFLDGREHATPELAEAVDAIAKDFEGFHYGRFDFRVPSVADLRAGRNLKLLEVNGLTSEPTHIYAPGNSVFYAWRTLVEGWHTAIRIGLEQRARGHAPWPLGRLFRVWWQSVRRQRRLR